MRNTGHTLLVAAVAVAVLAAVPGGAAAAGDLAVSGDQADDGTVTVTVTENGSAAANASVTVEALNNATYAGAGNYTADENGTVGLPAPEQNVSVSVTAAANNTTAETTLDLVAPTSDDAGLSVGVTQASDGAATVSVTNGTGADVANASVSVTTQDNATYAGAGDYTTGDNGTVGLPAPEQNVTVDVVAEANNQTASTTATLTATNGSEEPVSFGERVSTFVHQLQADGNMSGQQVAMFVVANNPGADNRPDHVDPGPPEDDEDDESDRGKNGNNGNGNGAGAENGNNGNGAGASNGNGNGGNGNGPNNGNSGNGNNGHSGNGNNGHSGNGNGNGGGNGNSGGPP